MDEKELLQSALEILVANQWQTMYSEAAEEREVRYCPFCAPDDELTSDQKAHRKICQFVQVRNGLRKRIEELAAGDSGEHDAG